MTALTMKQITQEIPKTILEQLRESRIQEAVN